MLSLVGRGKAIIQAEQCVKCSKAGSLLYKDHGKRTSDGWLHHLYGERRHKTSTAQLPYLTDVFSHGVVIQPSFGLELLFAVLTLQGILQLKELKASHQTGHILPRAAAGHNPVGGCCCSSTQWWDPEGSTVSLFPIPGPACSSELSLCCPGYCYQTHMPQFLENIQFWI